ncbi:unnamed protein product [Lepidochelys olivacea]
MFPACPVSGGPSVGEKGEAFLLRLSRPSGREGRQGAERHGPLGRAVTLGSKQEGEILANKLRSCSFPDQNRFVFIPFVACTPEPCQLQSRRYAKTYAPGWGGG